MKTRLVILLAITLAFTLSPLASLQAQPKREFRGAWIATVWGIDWPASWGQTSEAGIQNQKNELVTLLTNMHNAGMNAAYLQVRGFSDAMYHSRFQEEAWSYILTGTRGVDPGYDPLQLAITTAHGLGMELYAWVNPYRYASSSGNYGDLPTDYAHTHPDWLMHAEVKGQSILNPGIPAVQERVAAIAADITRNYDIDGVIFDDYFYQVTKTEEDSAQYNAYKRSTSSPMNLADWRRANVNKMVQMVRDSIKAVKPWVDFTIGPAGVAATSASVAASHGVTPCPVGSDWQYAGICSDPLAWFEQGTIDYMSPQCYWPIGHATNDFAQLSHWWLQVANHFGRHCYPSVSQSGQTIAQYADEVRLVRQYDMDDAPGTVVYNISTAVGQNMVTYLPANVFQHPSLPPAKHWLANKATRDLRVTSITKMSANTLHWIEPASNLRFAVYQVPTDSLNTPGVFAKSDYLLGISYTNQFKVTDRTGYTYAVAVLDRFENEYPPVVMGQGSRTLTAPTLLFPADNGTPLLPTYFSWNRVTNADSYYWQVSETATFDSIAYQHETTDTVFFSGKMSSMQPDKTYYWRVMARGYNARDVYSAVYSFHSGFFHLVAPADGETDVDLMPVLVADSVPTPTALYTFQIATNADMAAGHTVFRQDVAVPHVQVPANVLTASTSYYVRVEVKYGGITTTSAISSFKTLTLPTPVPSLITPHDGDTIVGKELRVAWEEQNALGFRAELSTATSFAGRLTKIKSTDAFVYECTYTDVKPGTYYLRLKALSENGYTEPSEVLTIYVEEPTALENVNFDNRSYKTIENGQVIIIRNGKKYNMLGQTLK